MVLRRFMFALLVVPAMAAMSAFATAVDRGVAFVRDCLAMFSPEPMRLAADGFDMQLSIGGTALARDVQHGLRHEAGVPRYAAQRNR